MSNEYCVFILTHGRPDNVITYETLKRQGYTGKIYIVIDDEDATADEYYKNFGNNVLMFSKEEIAKTFDQGDNFNDRRCIIYARNACFELAKQVGFKHFIQLDDDYTYFAFRVVEGQTLTQSLIKNLDRVFYYYFKLFRSSNALTIALSQGGDYIGGVSNPDIYKGYKRKAMNSFFCSLDRPFKFYGRINEDVNFYTCEGRKGKLIFSIYGVMLQQKNTQSNDGGMTDIYLDKGTYFKSFYSIMYSPSCVKIALMGNTSETKRIHHSVKWNNCTPMIISERLKKGVKNAGR